MTNAKIIQMLIKEAERRGFFIDTQDGDYISVSCQTLLDGEHEDHGPLSDDDRRLLRALQALV